MLAKSVVLPLIVTLAVPVITYTLSALTLVRRLLVAMLRSILLRPLRSIPSYTLRPFSTTPPTPPSTPTTPPPSRVAVIGGGQMGTGIAYVTSVTARLPVLIVDSSSTQLQRSRSFITSLLDKDQRKGRLDDTTKRQAMERFTFSSSTTGQPPPLPSLPHPLLHSLSRVALGSWWMNKCRSSSKQ